MLHSRLLARAYTIAEYVAGSSFDLDTLTVKQLYSIAEFTKIVGANKCHLDAFEVASKSILLYHKRDIEYNDKTDPEDDLPDEDVNAIDEIPVYSINKPRDESLAILKILSKAKGPQKMMKKNRLLEQLEEVGLVDKNLSGAAKHSRLKGLLNPISIAGGLDNPLVEVEYKGRQSNVILTTQGESTLKIFGE